MLTRPSYSELLKKINSKYQLVIVAAKRAAQLVENANLARQGLIPKYRPPQVDFFGKNFLTIALEEISQEKIELVRRPKKEKQALSGALSSKDSTEKEKAVVLENLEEETRKENE